MAGREVALEQALIAVLGAYRESGGDVEKLISEASGLIIGNTEYRIVEHPNVGLACKEIEEAAKFKK
ncbi:hypothetical protein H2Y57_00615 [Pectobacterium aroidearum]|uniref:Uncharacterized protein n=1 Tax=Pectobacterium aroidearum TaxID=1201031 RepID=A0AAW3SRG2_9GAMM|nr:hypothetical protein [Pectobacterium aroidearum]MBA5202205.1 hypothetical protein [Pectobacterium aroidearum]